MCIKFSIYIWLFDTPNGPRQVHWWSTAWWKKVSAEAQSIGSTFWDSRFQSVWLWNFSWPFLRIKTLDPTWECGFKAFQWRLGQPNLTKITLIPKNHRMMDVLFINVTHTHTLEQFRSNSIFSGRLVESHSLHRLLPFCIWFSFGFFHLHRNALWSLHTVTQEAYCKLNTTQQSRTVYWIMLFQKQILTYRSILYVYLLVKQTVFPRPCDKRGTCPGRTGLCLKMAGTVCWIAGCT